MAFQNNAGMFDYLMNEANANRAAEANSPWSNPGGLFTNGMMGAMGQLQSANQANQAVVNSQRQQQNQLNQQYNQGNQSNIAGLLGNEAAYKNQLAMQQYGNENSRAMQADQLNASRDSQNTKYNFLSSLLPQLYGSTSGGGFQGVGTNYGAGVSVGGSQAAPQSMGSYLNGSGSATSGTGGQHGSMPQMGNYTPPPAAQAAPQASGSYTPPASQGSNIDWYKNNAAGGWVPGQQSLAPSYGSYGSQAKQPGQAGYRAPRQASTGDVGADRRLRLQAMAPGYSPIANQYTAASGYKPRA